MNRRTSSLFIRASLLGIGVVIIAAFGVLLVRRFAPKLTVQSTPAPHALATGFTETQIAGALNSPTLMAVAPDGRLFVGQQGGVIRIIEGDQLLPTPFYTVATASYDEQGLSGLTFDPDFASNGFVYVTYSVDEGEHRTHQRLSRLTATGNTGGDEVTLFELPRSRIEYHLSGALQFGPDGMLYMTTGEGVGADVQNTSDFAGKILRLNPDGSIPTDNPFCQDPAKAACSIWAFGLRNPFVFNLRPDVEPANVHFYVNDVGGSSFEEVDDVFRSGNYGYPLSEGAVISPGQVAPVHSYPHANNDCAVVGGAFYTAHQFPAAYQNRYFFSDYCSGLIQYFDPASPGTPAVFGTARGVGLVSLVVGQDGSLYYLARGSTAADGGSGEGFDTGHVYKISYTASAAPYIITQPRNQTVSTGGDATFKIEAGGEGPLFYRWQRNGVDVANAVQASLVITQATLDENGAMFQAVVTNTAGVVTSTRAQLSVLDNHPPTATITLPPVGFVYHAGETLNFAGTGSDPDSPGAGALPASNFSWKIELRHGTHAHPFMPTTSGIISGSIQLPTVPHATSDVFYRIYLIVSDGVFSTTVTRDIYPAPNN